MKGWGGSCRGGVGWGGCVMKGWGGVGWVMKGWGGSKLKLMIAYFKCG